jgi:hypothetical protein
MVGFQIPADRKQEDSRIDQQEGSRIQRMLVLCQLDVSYDVSPGVRGGS